MAHSRLLVMGEDVAQLMDPYCEHDCDAICPRWDYYEIGGRFEGSLLLHDGTRGDSARVRDVDIAGMRQRAADAADTVWQAYQRELDQHGEQKPWQQCLEDADGDVARARGEYETQPIIKSLWRILPWGVSPDVFFEGGPEAFQDRARLGAVPDSRMLTRQDGWMAAGRIDLWGGTDATTKSGEDFLARANARLDAAKDNELLTIVDYHT